MSQPALEKANDTSGDKSIISRSVAGVINVKQLVFKADPDEEPKQNEVRMLKLQAYAIMFTLFTLVTGGILYFIADTVSSAALANSEITFLQYIKILTYGVVLLSAAGAAYYGLYFSHAYGATSEQIDLIKTAQELLSEHSNIIKAQVTDLGKEVGGITQLTDNQLKSTMQRFSSIISDGKEIGRISKLIKDNDKENIKLFKDIEDILKLTNILQRQIRKNKLITMFHELEHQDKEDGLNKEEYKLFLARLDKDTADAFRDVTSFRKMDRNFDGVIDINEFQNALDKVYDRLDKKDKLIVEQFNKTLSAEF